MGALAQWERAFNGGFVPHLQWMLAQWECGASALWKLCAATAMDGGSMGACNKMGAQWERAVNAGCIAGSLLQWL
jgi:hypothetical protein